MPNSFFLFHLEVAVTFRIRLARPGDAAQVLDVYAPYVRDTTVSFELAVPSVDDYAQRIAHGLASTTYLVVEAGGAGDHSDDRRIVGFATYGAFGHRAAYQWSAETSIFLSDDCTGHGVGAELLSCLEDIMRAGGIVTSEACICSENTGSIAFHRRHGYRVVGEHRSCASKFGRWLSIQWLEKPLAAYRDDPEPPTPCAEGVQQLIIGRANERLAGRDGARDA